MQLSHKNWIWVDYTHLLYNQILLFIIKYISVLTYILNTNLQ